MTALQTAAPWLETGPYDPLCRTSNDALDAVIAALTARAAALGLTHRPDPELQLPASREGWIALPAAPLSALLEGAASIDPSDVPEPRLPVRRGWAVLRLALRAHADGQFCA